VKAGYLERMKKDVLKPLKEKDRGRYCEFRGQQRKQISRSSILNKAGVKKELLDCQSKEASILWSHHEKTRKLPGERDNVRNNATCMQARKTTHSLDR